MTSCHGELATQYRIIIVIISYVRIIVLEWGNEEWGNEEWGNGEWGDGEWGDGERGNGGATGEGGGRKWETGGTGEVCPIL